MLEIKDASIKAGEQQLFSRLSLTVDDGQALCLVGGGGAGKTLLLRAVMGLWPLYGGYITVDGELLTPSSAPVFRRHTAYVPQSPAPMAEKVETLARLPYTLEANKGKTFSKDRLMDEWHLLGLAPELYAKRDAELTVSQRQRILMATAATLGKSIVLIDEPFDGADDAGKQLVADYLVHLAQGEAAVLATSRQTNLNDFGLNIKVI